MIELGDNVPEVAPLKKAAEIDENSTTSLQRRKKE